LRVSLGSYLQSDRAKVFSLVADVPFSPLDIDLGHLARGEWNPHTDRFRLWYLPEEAGEKPSCYLMVRKFDPGEGVLVYAHMVVNLEAMADSLDQRSFTVGVMSNDEVRARAMLNSMLGIPPSYHKRSEVRLVERKWRNDPDAVIKFLANIHSAMSQMVPNPSSKVYTVKFEPPPKVMEELKRGMGKWWG